MKQCIGGDDKCVDLLLGEDRKGCIDVPFATRGRAVKLLPQWRTPAHAFRLALGISISRVDEVADYGGAHQLAQQLQPFRRE